MNNHAYKVLEFYKLKELIAKYAITDEAIEKILDFEPFTDINKLRKELEITLHFFEFSKYDGGAELSGIKNIEPFIKKTSLIGTYLDPEELYHIKKNIRTFRVTKSKIEELEGKYRTLFAKIKDIPVYKGIEDLIEKAVNDNGEINDGASPDLADIRRHKKLLADNIKNRFEELFNNPNNAKAIQDKIVTVREGRSVIPIKADFKGQIKGIEHDRSSSGQTVFIEPLTILPLNNKMREYEVREREEIKKILLRLTDTVRFNNEGLLKIAETLIELDLLNAKTSFAKEYKCNKPTIIDKEQLKIVEGRHPFIPQESVVPLTFELGKTYDIMLITGPNTGGKTVALKVAGLLTLMALSGMMIPASEKTEIGMFNGVFADIGDEQSIEQNLSSFSGHLKNVQEILEKVTKNSLVLLDELGSGTDPMEGSAFAMAVIDYLKEKKSKTIVSTHFSEVKAYGYNEEGVESASMEFNAETLSPTYRLLLGIPGESNALKIARRLGVSEEILKRAEAYISEEDKKVETMIATIKEKSKEVEETQAEVTRLKAEAERFKNSYEEKLRNFENEKNLVLKEAYETSDKLIKDAQEKAKALIEKFKKEEINKEELKATEKALHMLRNEVREDKEKNVIKEIKLKSNLKISKGERVYIKSLNGDAMVLKVMEDKELAQVQAGVLKLTVSFHDIKKIEDKKVKSGPRVTVTTRSSAKSEIDLRGKMVDDAIHELENYLDRAMMSGYGEVNVIHGKGTGQLRKGLQEFLRTCPYIDSYRDANQNEGGLGCTVVKFK